MKEPPLRPAFWAMLELWLRTALWFPVTFLIGLVMLGACMGTLFLPLLAVLEIYLSDYFLSGVYLVGAAPAFFIARWMLRKFW